MKNNETQPVSIDITVLTEQVNKGMKKAELAEFYGIPVTQMTSALKQAGLKIRKFHHPKFVLVNNNNNTTENLGDTAKEEVSKEEELMVGDLFSQSEEVQEEPVATQEAEETTSNSVSWED